MERHTIMLCLVDRWVVSMYRHHGSLWGERAEYVKDFLLGPAGDPDVAIIRGAVDNIVRCLNDGQRDLAEQQWELLSRTIIPKIITEALTGLGVTEGA